MPPLRGALAASVTPLANAGGQLDDEAFGPLVDFFVAAGLDGILALGTAGEGILLDGGRAARRGRPLPAGVRAPAPGRRPLRRAVHGRDGEARRARGRGRRGRGRRHRPAVLQARRARAARALPRCRARMRTAALLRLRVRVHERVRRRAARARAAAPRCPERRGAEGVRHALRPLLALPARRLRRLRRPGGAHPSGDGGGRGRRSVRARVRVPGGGGRGRPRSRPPRAPRASPSCARSSSASRGRPRSSASSGGRASRCERTCARRSGA